MIYSAIASYAKRDEEVYAFINDLQRSVGTYLYGRRMYRDRVYSRDTD